MKSNIQNLIVFDLETSGLSNTSNCILEIACCPFDFELNDLKEFESGVMKVYDNRDIQQQALDANGITREQIEKGRDPKQVIEELCTFFTKLKVGNSKPVLCGHNVDKFDIPFLDNMFTYFKKDLSKFVNTDFTIDTMWWARLKKSEQTNYKLGTCCEEEGVELINAHRAITDTRANAQLLKKYLRNFRSDSSGENQEKRFRTTFQF